MAPFAAGAIFVDDSKWFTVGDEDDDDDEKRNTAKAVAVNGKVVDRGNIICTKRKVRLPA